MDKLKKYRFILLCTASLFILEGCKSYRNPDPYRTSDVVINVSSRTSSIKDSLTKTGIDTLFVFRKSCKNCQKQNIVYNGKKIKKGIDYSLPSYAEPSYVFWVSNGKYFIKKIDQFAEYKPIERQVFNQFPLYDYFLDNNELIRNEKPVREFIDTIFEPREYGPADIKFKKTYVYYYEPKENTSTTLIPMSNTVDLLFHAPGILFEKTIDENIYNPIVTTPDVLRYVKQNDRSNSYIVGNDLENYMMNRSMKIYIWMKMIESELFDVEMRQLWIALVTK